MFENYASNRNREIQPENKLICAVRCDQIKTYHVQIMVFKIIRTEKKRNEQQCSFKLYCKLSREKKHENDHTDILFKKRQ